MRRAAAGIALLPAPLWAGPFESRVKPLVRKHCAACHGPKNPAGGLNVEPLLAAPRDRERWEKIAARLRAREMPPKTAPQPPAAEVDRALAWLDAEFARQDREAKPTPGRLTLRRLNRYEYDHSVRDLLGVDMRPSDSFPPDPYGYGFDNIVDALSLPPVLAEKYMDAAALAARAAVPVPGETAPPVMERYLAERMGQDEQLHLSVDHVFPVDGEYTPRSAWYQALRGGLKVRLRLFLDGREVANQVLSFFYEMDRGLEAKNLPVTAGLHRVEATIAVEPGQKFTGRLPYLEYIQIYGPARVTPAAETAAYRRMFACGHDPGGHSASCARRVLEPLARRAYRRPLSPNELDELLGLVQRAAEREPFEQAVRTGVRAILVSPHFLFRMERDPPGAGPHPVSGHELASRLSYFLWSSIPDDSLAAAQGQLRRPDALRAQVSRMLADPKSRALAESFAGQWLQTRNLAAVTPDRKRFPAFTSDLRDDMRTETEQFFQAMLREDRSILDLVDARFTFLNERLATHYGIEGVKGPEFRRVELDGVRRAGVITHASVLTVSSYPTRTSPVIRGKWILENIFDTPPPAPPPDVPPLDEKAVGSAGSMRTQLERHRANPTCAACHGRMDPLGFGLENYDAIGRWRDKDGAFPVDAKGALPDGRVFDGPAGLRQLVRSQPREFTRAFAGKMLVYALGRGLEPHDRPALARIVEHVEKHDYRISEVAQAIAASVPFRMRERAAQ